MNDALVACAIPLIQTYGYSARIEKATDQHALIYCNRHGSYYTPNKCSYHWTLNFDKETRAWVIDSASSKLSHNHGINPELAKNPTWRPPLYNPVVKAALKLADAPCNQAIGKRTSRNESAGRSRPNARPDSGASDVNEIVASQAAAKRLKTNKIVSRVGYLSRLGNLRT